MTTREKYLAKPRTDFKTIAYNIARMLGLKCNMIHPKAVREYSTSRQLTYHEVILLVAAALAITAITTLASCSADDTAATTITPNQPIHEPIEVNIGSNLTVTRSTTDGLGETWAGGEKVVLVVTNHYGNTGGGTASTSKYVYQVDGSGTSQSLVPKDLANTNFWSSTAEKKKIESAWSYGNNTTEPTLEDNTITKFTLPIPQGNTELLYAPAVEEKVYTASPTNSFSLTFYHQLAKVVFLVKSDVATSVTADSQTMNIPRGGTITQLKDGTNPGSWTFENEGGNVLKADVKPVAETLTSEETADGVIAKYSAVIIPGDYNGYKMLQVDCAEGTCSYTPSSTLDIPPGTRYTFTITLKNGTMKFSSVSVSEWTVETTQNLLFQ